MANMFTSGRRTEYKITRLVKFLVREGSDSSCSKLKGTMGI